MFGIKRKKQKTDMVITSASEAVNNILYITSSTEHRFSIATTLFDSEGNHLDTIVSTFNETFDAAMREELTLLYNGLTNIEHPTATRTITVVIHPDINEAERLVHTIEDIPLAYYLKPISTIASDGDVWRDTTVGNTGLVERETISDFQLFSLADGKNILPYE